MKRVFLIVLLAAALILLSIKYVEPARNFARDNIPTKFLQLIGEKPSLTGYFNSLKRKASEMLDN